MQFFEITDKEALFFLSTLSELGYASKKEIYEKIKPLYNIFTMSFDDLKTGLKLKEKQIHAVLKLKNIINNLHEEYLSLADRNIKFILPFEDSYP